MEVEIYIANSDQAIDACYPAFKELRPHLSQGDFLPQVRRQQLQGYQILALRENAVVKSVAGFRFGEYLAWGKILYIDDLSTLPDARGKGYAEQLIDWLIVQAKTQNCNSVHLDTGYARHNAHRLYLRKKMLMTSHHMSLTF